MANDWNMLAELLSRYDRCKLECDGLTRVISTVLTREGIEHICFVGSIAHKPSETDMSPHFWVRLPDNRFIDYRARMWLGERNDVPHGIFQLADFPSVEYVGEAIDLEPLPTYLFAILTET